MTEMILLPRLNPHFVVLAVHALSNMIEAPEHELVKMIYMYDVLFEDDHKKFKSSNIAEDVTDLGEELTGKLCDALSTYLLGRIWPDMSDPQVSINQFFKDLSRACEDQGWRFKHL